MTERFVIAHHPKSATVIVHQTFMRKGLAFAYVARKLPRDRDGAIVLERQIAVGTGWKRTDTWEFHTGGDVQHKRCGET
jgi:hypothetical protein